MSPHIFRNASSHEIKMKSKPPPPHEPCQRAVSSHDQHSSSSSTTSENEKGDLFEIDPDDGISDNDGHYRWGGPTQVTKTPKGNLERKRPHHVFTQTHDVGLSGVNDDARTTPGVSFTSTNNNGKQQRNLIQTKKKPRETQDIEGHSSDSKMQHPLDNNEELLKQKIESMELEMAEMRKTIHNQSICPRSIPKPTKSTTRKINPNYIPMLARNLVMDLLEGERQCYYMELNDEVPYVLPFKSMPIVCHFCENSFETYQLANHHFQKLCEQRRIVSKTSKSDKICKLQWKDGDNRLYLRVSDLATKVSCICGTYRELKHIKEHFKECEYVKSFKTLSSSFHDAKTIPYNPPTRIRTISNYGRNSTTKLKKYLSITSNIHRKMKSRKSIADRYEKMCKLFDDDTVKVYFPEDDPSFFQVSTTNVRQHFRKLEVICNSNFDNIIQLIKETEAMADVNGEDSFDTYGVRNIQSHRCEIRLNFNSLDNEQCQFWNQFCERFKYKSSFMSQILNLATNMTKVDLGPDYYYGSVATPSLIMCTTESDQIFHLDLLKKKNKYQQTMIKQYTMMVSNFCNSTTVYKTSHSETSPQEHFKNLWIALDEQMQITSEQGGISSEFKTNLAIYEEKYFKGSVTYAKMISGFGALFHICLESQKQNKHKRKESFRWQSKTVENLSSGSVMAMEGSVIHAGSGSNTDGNVRIILFWTWSHKDIISYDENIQETKLTVIIEFAAEFFRFTKKESLRKEMLRIIRYCYDTSNQAYKKTCPETFNMYKYVPDMLKDWYKGSKHDKMDEKWLRKSNLFANRQMYV